jgi:superfamily II DNA or RNA helicase
VSPVNRSAMAFNLRSYQKRALACLDDAFTGRRRPTGPEGVARRRVGIVSATGTGKTVMFTSASKDIHEAGGRSLIIVPSDAIANQTKKEMHGAMPSANVGLVMNTSNDVNADIVIASYQTLGKPNRLEQLQSDGFDLGIVDEFHHSTSISYRRIMTYFDVKWAGFSATPSRSDKAHLGDIWEEIAFTYSTADAIRDGNLVMPRGVRVQVADLNLDEVKRSRGDLQANDLGEALTDANAGTAIAKAYRKECPDRRGIIYAPTVATAYEFAECMRDAGFTCETVEANTIVACKAQLEHRSKDCCQVCRYAIYERFRTGETLVISNCGVLIEGFNAPWAEVGVIARATESETVYIQMVGRLLRPWLPGGKKDALILDVVGVSEKHSIMGLSKLTLTPEDAKQKEKKERKPKSKLDADPLPSEYVGNDGELVTTVVDLMARSTSRWLQTRNTGLWFVPVKGAYFFLWPEGDGNFTLGRQPSYGKATKIESGLPLDYGMAWGERYADDEDEANAREGGARIGSKSASWRQGNRPPTPAQVAEAERLNATYAQRLGMEPIEVVDTTKRKLSDDISIFNATRLLDRHKR